MRKVGVVLIAVLMMGWTLSVTRAQEPLTETFTDKDGAFSFMYPSGMDIVNSDSAQVTLAGNDLTIQISYQGNPEYSTSFKDFVVAFASAGTEAPVITEVQVGDRKLDKALVKLGPTVLEFIGADLGDGKVAIFTGTGYNASVDKLDPTLIAVAASFQVGTGSGSDTSATGAVTSPYSGGQAEALTQSYTHKSDSSSFSYRIPDGWTVHDAGVDSGASLSRQAISISIDYPSNFPGSVKDVVAAAAQFAAPLPEVEELQLNGRDAGRVLMARGEVHILYVGVAYGDKVALFTLVGSPDDVTAVEPTLRAIISSFIPDTAVPPQVTTAQVTQSAVATEAAAVVPRPVVNGVSMIAFTTTDLDRAGIAITDPTGQNVTPITHNHFTDWLPAFSPDGTMIAFVAEDDPNNFDAWDVYVVGSNGGEPRKISSKPSTSPAAVAWSPDSKQLIFIALRADADGGPGIYKVNVDGSGEQKLSLDGMDGTLITLDLLDWSPDGQRIAFVGVPPSANDWTFVFADADGTHLTAGPAFNIAQVGTTFQWSPDDQHALYSDAASLEVTAADGTNPTVLVDKSENLRLMGASWSPDGRQIAFVATNQTGTTVGLYVMNADGSNRQKLDLGKNDPVTLGVSWGTVPTGQAATAEVQATAAVADDTKLVTATAGGHTVSVRLPTTPGVTVRDFSRDSIDLSMTGISIIGFDVDVQFPPSVSGGTTAKTMIESKLSYAKGPITEFQVDGREAARLDAENRDNSEYVYMIVKTAAGDYVDVEFTVLVDKKEEVEPAMLALLASVTTGDPNAQPAAQPTIETGDAAATVSCSVTANGTANLRSGPGTSFAKAGTLAAGASASVTGQATGTDGNVWYQLDSGSYVRSDLVRADGDCASVPTVSP